jgi:hypothetical protein
MWIFSREGFYSIVDKEDGYHVRARRKQDLVNVGLTATKSHLGSDYPWRAILPSRAELLRLMEALGNSVDYPNFKGHIASLSDQKDRLARYHKIWAMMAEEKESEGG